MAKRLPQAPGVSYMPLLGDRGRPGAFVYRVRAAHGVRIPPHWHTKTMHLTVLSGTLMVVMTESADSGRAGPTPRAASGLNRNGHLGP